MNRNSVNRSIAALQLVALALLILALSPVREAKAAAGPEIVLDNIGQNGLAANTGSGVTSVTFTHNVVAPTTDKTLLVVGVAIRNFQSTDSTIQSVASIESGLDPMALSTAGWTLDVSNNAKFALAPPPFTGDTRAELWYVRVPPQGLNTIKVTLTGAADVVVQSLSFKYVNQVNPVAFRGTGNNTNADDTPVVSAASGTRMLEVGLTASQQNGSTGPISSIDTNPGLPNQTERWKAAVGSATQGLVAAGATIKGAFLNTTMAWQNNPVGDDAYYASVQISLQPDSTTAVGMNYSRARHYPEGTLVTWRSGRESSNIGYNVYREADGSRTCITPDLIAGSALYSGRLLSAGYSYAWFDRGAPDGSTYWIEDVDLNGGRTMHGPIRPVAVDSSLSSIAMTPLLSDSADGFVAINQVVGESASSRPVALLADKGASKTGQQQYALASQSAVKISVRERGWYRVTGTDLSAAGFDASRVDPTTFQLFAEGKEQAVRVIGEADGRFDPNDAIEFFGTGLDLPSTDTRAYWLTSGSRSGLRIKTLSTKSQQTITQSFAYTVKRVEKQSYFAAPLNNGDTNDNFIGRVVAAQPVSQVIPVRNLDTASTSSAAVEVALQGMTTGAHATTVSLNGSTLGTISGHDTSQVVQKFTVPTQLLANGDNTVTLTRLGGPLDVSAVLSVQITYAHKSVADDNSLLLTTGPRQPSRTITGFTSGSVRVVDVTNPAAPVELLGSTSCSESEYAITVPIAGSSSRRLYAFAADRVKRPVEIAPDTPSTWNASYHDADIVMISHRDFIPGLAPLRQLREGQGHRVAIVDIQDVYDEFSFGEKFPQAIHLFLDHARSSWRSAPRFVLLVGDATFDPRDYYGAFGVPNYDFVPTRLLDTETMETASDDWFADFDGNSVPDMAIGRLPVRTPDEAQTVVSKIVAYEQSGRASRSALFVSDSSDVYNFPLANTNISNLLPPDMSQTAVSVDDIGVTQARQQILSGLASGPGIVNYAGHGSVDVWRGDLLTTDDVATLGNTAHLAFFSISNCLNGYFQDPLLEGLGEALLKSPSGGAVGVWASTGTTDGASQAATMSEFYRQLFSVTPITIGEAAVRAKAASTLDVRRTWVLLGDPATRVQ